MEEVRVLEETMGINIPNFLPRSAFLCGVKRLTENDLEAALSHELLGNKIAGVETGADIEEGEAVQSSSSPPSMHPETIDLDSDLPEKLESAAAVQGSSNTTAVAVEEDEEEEVDFDQRVGSILEELEMVSIEEAEKYGLMFHGKDNVLGGHSV
jgi:hypothetical protein